MKNAMYLFILSVLFPLSLKATTVTDAENHSPIIYASVIDANGAIVAVTDLEGVYTEESPFLYPVTIRSMGYAPLTLNGPEEQVEMSPVAYDLQEVVISPTTQQIQRQICYVRQYMTMACDKDTTLVLTEQMIDFFIPVTKVEGYKGKKGRRKLAERRLACYKDIHGNDSLSTKVDNSDMDLITVPWKTQRKVTERESLKGKTEGVDSINGKYYPSVFYQVTKESYIVMNDELADEKRHAFSPTMMKMMGLTMDFNQMTSKYEYIRNEEGVYSQADVRYATITIGVEARGKLFKKKSSSKHPIDLRFYIELYTVRNEWMSAEEAMACQKKKPVTEFEVPAIAVPYKIHY